MNEEVLNYEEFVSLKEATTPLDSEELLLYIENNGQLYKSMTTPIITNLKKNIAKGNYDKTLALKSWNNLADAGAKEYAKELGEGKPWNMMFSVAIRKETAVKLADSYSDDLTEETK
jgi:hypothetical protein